MTILRNSPALVSLMLSSLATLVLAASSPASTVLEAVANKDVAALRSLLKSGADVNAAMGDGLTAIHQVAIDGDQEIAQLLIYAGANLKATTRLGGYTPLLLAAKNGDAGMIKTLLSGGADPNTPTTNGTTPLMFAAAAGTVDGVTALLDKGADAAATEKAMGQTAMMFAAALGRAEMVQLLVKRGANPKAATKVVDLNVFTKEAQEAFAAAVAGGTPPKAADPATKASAPASTPTTAPPGPAGKSGEPASPMVSDDGDQAGSAPTEATEKVAKAPRAPEAGIPEAGIPEAGIKDAPPRIALAAPPPADPKPVPAAPEKAAEAPKPKKPQVPGVDRNYLYNEIVGHSGGMTPLHLGARQGTFDVVKVLLDAGADINALSGDQTSPLLMATINGQFDLALYLLEHGADPKLASENGVTPLYAAVNVQWAPKALYPQPRAYLQQKASHLDLMKALLDKGAEVDARIKKKVWYSGYNFDLSGVDEGGATAFWRAAYASDVEAMKLLVAHGANPNIRTVKAAGRPRTGDGQRDTKDVSGLAPVPTGGPAITALQAAAGVGYGEGFAANSHRFAPGGMLAAVKYLVDELHADVNAIDHEGNTALHHAAARGDNEMIRFLVSRGANVMVVNREGQTTVDMANAPVQRVEPFPESIALLASMGARNNHKCVSCDDAPVKKADTRK